MAINTAEEIATGDESGTDLLFMVQWGMYNNIFIASVALYLIAILVLLLKESFLSKLTERVPESLVLIIIGVAVGAIGRAAKVNTILENIDDRYIINFLLPPIILEAAYHLYSRQLIYQLDGILMFSVIGTILNIFALGFSLFGVYGWRRDMGALHCLLFASIVSAVDPVAVLAVFNQIGVARSLYMIIFGESLFNDGVTMVFFEGLEKLAEAGFVDPIVYAYAFLSLFTVSFGGLFIGFSFGILSAIFCKVTSPKSRLLEPIIILLCAYLAFLLSQLVHWSGFLALIACGLAQKRYAFPNLFEKTRVTIIEMTETMATMSESLVFLLLGLNSYIDEGWDVEFIAWTLLFITLYRALIIWVLSSMINVYRLQNLTYRHMIIMSYGGLRGAVSYALAASVKSGKHGPLFLTTTMAVIFFTVFIQGGTMRFIVIFLNFKESKRKLTFTKMIIERLVFLSLAGTEEILGGFSTRMHYWIERLEQCDKKYFRKHIVLRNKDLSGFTDFIHHKELHLISRLHGTKNQQDDDFSSETPYASSVSDLSLGLRTAPESSESSHWNVPRDSEMSQPRLSIQEKVKHVKSYEKDLLEDQRGHFRQDRKTRTTTPISDREKGRRRTMRRKMLTDMRKTQRRRTHLNRRGDEETDA